jgi:hypothetical protein
MLKHHSAVDEDRAALITSVSSGPPAMGQSFYGSLVSVVKRRAGGAFQARRSSSSTPRPTSGARS